MEFLGVADDKSMILATSKKGDAGRDASQRGSPERAIIGQKAELSGIYLNETSQRPFIDVAAPIVVNGKSIGVVFGAVSLDAFFKSAIEPLATGKSIRTLLLSPDNVVVPATPRVLPLHPTLAARRCTRKQPLRRGAAACWKAGLTTARALSPHMKKRASTT